VQSVDNTSMPLDFNQLFPTLNAINTSGTIRSIPEDFKVTEINSIELSGEGEHLWLYVQKIGCNTDWVANQLANICQVSQRQVGYAGLKDRHAVTQQWFSVQLSKVTDQLLINDALPDEVSVIESKLHSRKIKTGQLEANQFEIMIREIDGDKSEIENNIQSIIESGVPNYFGPQRFGHDMGNIQKAQDWFSGTYKVKARNLKSLLLSSARSHIFNCIVAQRINDKTWSNPINGDIFQLNKSHSWFPEKDATPDEISKRLKEFDIHITAAMAGEDCLQSTGDCANLECSIINQFPIYQQGFEKFRLKQDRRAMRICPIDLDFEWENGDLKLKFKLLPGSYATGILREIINYQ
jgi:tRNA pseudouridine13 synthase